MIYNNIEYVSILDITNEYKRYVFKKGENVKFSALTKLCLEDTLTNQIIVENIEFIRLRGLVYINLDFYENNIKQYIVQ